MMSDHDSFPPGWHVRDGLARQQEAILAEADDLERRARELRRLAARLQSEILTREYREAPWGKP